MSNDNPPPFLPLEEANNSDGGSFLEDSKLKRVKSHKKGAQSAASADKAKKLVGLFFAFVVLFLLHDTLFTPPEKRFIKPDASDRFLRWVQVHPLRGIGAFMLVIASAVVLLLPVGTPLTIGCGFVYKTAYGWRMGFFIGIVVSMAGSAAGAVACFLLGRYLLRDHVRTWIRKYPLLVAIDIAAAEHGLKILAMVYLTPIAPLGPLSYMCGTTSMALSHFALAKLASLPIMSLYVFIGASAGALVAASSRDSGHLEENAAKLENNPTLLFCGIVISVVMISAISIYVKKELFKILERQKKMSSADWDSDAENDMEEGVVAMNEFAHSRPVRHRIVSTDSRHTENESKPLM